MTRRAALDVTAPPYEPGSAGTAGRDYRVPLSYVSAADLLGLNDEPGDDAPIELAKPQRPSTLRAKPVPPRPADPTAGGTHNQKGNKP